MKNMLEHQIIVLENVSHSKELFKKELLKSLNWLEEEEILQLKEWLMHNIAEDYSEVIQDILEEKMAS